MKKIIIVGAGFSSAVLSSFFKNQDISIYDKGRGPGGRCSTRRVDKVGFFDHGLQFISPKNNNFLLFLNINLKKYITNWEGNFFKDNELLEKKIRWIGKDGNNDFVRNLLHANVYFNKELCKLYRNEKQWNLEFKDGTKEITNLLILTLPLEQCKKLIQSLNLNLILDGKMEPTLSAMLAFKEKTYINGSGYTLTKNNILGWCANESSKGREKNNKNLELWSIQSTSSYAKKNHQYYKEKKNEILKEMIDAFVKHFKLENKEIVYKNIHGWSYAQNNNPKTSKYIWLPKLRLGICGDWMSGPKAENAWESSSLLFKAMAKDMNWTN